MEEQTKYVAGKICKMCGTAKPLNDFFDHATRPDKHRWECKECTAKIQVDYSKKHRVRLNKNMQKYKKNVKDMAFEAYGGYMCATCGEKREPCLTLDHIDNDGAAHRKAIGASSYKLYAWLKKHNYPPMIQVLCRNCNWIKYHEYNKQRASRRKTAAAKIAPPEPVESSNASGADD